MTTISLVEPHLLKHAHPFSATGVSVKWPITETAGVPCKQFRDDVASLKVTRVHVCGRPEYVFQPAILMTWSQRIRRARWYPISSGIGCHAPIGGCPTQRGKQVGIQGGRRSVLCRLIRDATLATRFSVTVSDIEFRSGIPYPSPRVLLTNSVRDRRASGEGSTMLSSP